jgi:hypothetical protein
MGVPNAFSPISSSSRGAEEKKIMSEIEGREEGKNI